MKLTLEETFIRLSEFETKELTQTCNELQIKYKMHRFAVQIVIIL